MIIGATTNLSPKFDSKGLEVYWRRNTKSLSIYKKWHLIYNSTGIRINEQDIGAGLGGCEDMHFGFQLGYIVTSMEAGQRYGKQWSKKRYSDSARGRMPKRVGHGAIDGIFIRKAEDWVISNSNSWQKELQPYMSFGRISRKGSGKGDYIVCKMKTQTTELPRD